MSETDRKQIKQILLEESISSLFGEYYIDYHQLTLFIENCEYKYSSDIKFYFYKSDCSYDDEDIYIQVYTMRTETDYEYNYRMNATKISENRMKEYRRKQYEELKKEFG